MLRGWLSVRWRWFVTAMCMRSRSPQGRKRRSDRVHQRESAMDRSTEDRVLALDPANISPADVRDVLAHAPAPRIITLRWQRGADHDGRPSPSI